MIHRASFSILLGQQRQGAGAFAEEMLHNPRLFGDGNYLAGFLRTTIIVRFGTGITTAHISSR